MNLKKASQKVNIFDKALVMYFIRKSYVFHKQDMNLFKAKSQMKFTL